MDEVAVIKARKGDRDSFSKVINEVKDQAYRVAFCYLHNEEDSMDAVCDAIEKCYKNIKKLKEPKYFKTWFIRIVINECKLQLRAKQNVISMADDIYENKKESIHKEEEIDLRLLLDELPALDRLLIYLKYYMGYTLEEIADMVEMSSGTVKTKIYSNLKRMKSRLEIKEV